MIQNQPKITIDQRLECMRLAVEMCWRGPNRIFSTFELSEYIELHVTGEAKVGDIMIGLSNLDVRDWSDRKTHHKRVMDSLGESDDIEGEFGDA